MVSSASLMLSSSWSSSLAECIFREDGSIMAITAKAPFNHHNRDATFNQSPNGNRLAEVTCCSGCQGEWQQPIRLPMSPSTSMLLVFDYATACRCFPSERFPLCDLQLCCSYRSLLSPDIQPCIDESQSKHKNPIELRSIRCDRWACSCNPTTINRTHRNEKSFRKWVKL